MMNADEIRRMLIMKKDSAVPEGWGRSVVGNQVVVTAPSGPTTSSILDTIDNGGVVNPEAQMKPFFSSQTPSYEEVMDENEMRKMGKMPVGLDPKTGERIYVEKDLSNPNSIYADPKTGTPFYDNLKEQKDDEDEWKSIMDNFSSWRK